MLLPTANGIVSRKTPRHLRDHRAKWNGRGLNGARTGLSRAMDDVLDLSRPSDQEGSELRHAPQAVLRAADAALLACLPRTLRPVLVQRVDPERVSAVRGKRARQVGVVAPRAANSPPIGPQPVTTIKALGDQGAL